MTSAHGVEPPPHPWDYKTIAVLAVVHLGALCAPFFFSWSALLVAFLCYSVTALGITLGYHRLLTHQSYKAPRWLGRLIVFLGSQSAQAGPCAWVAIHRAHHARSDQEDDPHDASRGFWWSHLGWMLVITPRRLDPDFTRRLARDVVEDPFYRFLDRYFLPLCIGTGVVFFFLGGWPWVFWGMFARIAAVFHATWLVNSAAHGMGYRSYRTGDLSTNNWWVALLTFGEGWHNNHHAFPTSARHGLGKWELDISWLILRMLEKMKLISDLKVPSAQKLDRFALNGSSENTDATEDPRTALGGTK